MKTFKHQGLKGHEGNAEKKQHPLCYLVTFVFKFLGLPR
jgi:hypothetical protein